MNVRSFSCLRTALAAFAVMLAVAAPAQVERGAPLPRRAWIGVQSGPAEGPGAKLVRVVPGGTAEALGLLPDDVVVEVDQVQVATAADLGRAVAGRTEGDPVRVKYLRRGEPAVADGTMRGRPKQKEDGLEVVYDQVVSQGRRVRVIATHPQGPGPFPTVFLIGGIGAYSTDGDYASIPYGNILGPLARSGYAVVRVDKPGQGDSEGPSYSELLFDQELDAYLQALRLAKTLPFVDARRIAIFGHSMGGSFGPLVAAEEPVAAVVAAATLSKTWAEYMLENTRRQSALGGASPAQVDETVRQTAAITHYLYYEGLTVEQIAERRPELAAAVRAMSPDGKTYSGVGFGFFRQLAGKNLAEAWAKTDAKVLALWGENDFVSSGPEHAMIAEIVNAARPGTAEFRTLPRSDHGFSETDSPADSLAKWGRPGGKFNDNVVAVLKDWLGKALGG